MQLRKAMNKARKGRKAQGMTEYIIIVALIAIAAIGVVTLFGNNLRKIFGVANDALAGEQSAESKAKKTKGTLLKSKNLKSFNDKNDPE